MKREAEIIESYPELVQFCLNCNADHCIGTCEAYRRAKAAAKGNPVRETTHSKMYTHKGKTMNLSQWAVTLGIPRKTLDGRLKRGLSVDVAFTAPVSKNFKLKITCGDETHTLSEWSKITGLHTETIRYRLNHGWPVEKALFTTKKEKEHNDDA